LFDFASTAASSSFASSFITNNRFKTLCSESLGEEHLLFDAPKYPIKEISCSSKIRSFCLT
jgi:hypothetical protein